MKKTEVAPSHWTVTSMSINISGKVLLFKSINVQEVETHNDFGQVEDGLTLAEVGQRFRSSSKDTIDG